MKDDYFTLEKLIMKSHETAKEKGFWDIKDVDTLEALEYLNKFHKAMFDTGILNEKEFDIVKTKVIILRDKISQRNVGELLMLIVSELGEALEALRKGKFGLEQKDTFEDEIADTFIRLGDLSGGLKIDVVKQILWMMNYNKNRERLHGKKF